MKPRFLLDENVEAAILRQLRRLYPEIELIAVGEANAPALQSQDPEVLAWIAAHNYLLVTHDRRSMPTHIADHYEQGGELPGVLLIRRGASIHQVVSYWHLLWSASEMAEYRNVISYIP